jgi:hypothetical protein
MHTDDADNGVTMARPYSGQCLQRLSIGVQCGSLLLMLCAGGSNSGSWWVCLQVLIALREELAAAHRAHSEAAHRLRAQRQKAAPWR